MREDHHSGFNGLSMDTVKPLKIVRFTGSLWKIRAIGRACARDAVGVGSGPEPLALARRIERRHEVGVAVEQLRRHALATLADQFLRHGLLLELNYGCTAPD